MISDSQRLADEAIAQYGDNAAAFMATWRQSDWNDLAADAGVRAPRGDLYKYEVRARVRALLGQSEDDDAE